MPYKVSWCVEGHIIHVESHEILTVDEIPALFEDVRTYVGNGIQPVHLITDLSRLKHTPTSLTAMRQVPSSLEGVTLNILIGVNHPMVHFLLNVMSQLIKIDYRLVDNLQDALAMIARLDSSAAQLIERLDCE